MHKMTAPTAAAPAAAALDAPLSAPKYGTLIPNRIFVGGISGDTTEADLNRVFSAYGTVKSTKIIVDRAGVSKGYGFVTFETEQEAQRLQADGECVVLRDRKLNIAPAIKKQSIVATNGAVYYTTTPPAPISNMPIDQFTAVYPPAAAGVPAIYPPSAMQYQPFYQYYSVPMNVPTIWPQNYQEISYYNVPDNQALMMQAIQPQQQYSTIQQVATPQPIVTSQLLPLPAPPTTMTTGTTTHTDQVQKDQRKSPNKPRLSNKKYTNRLIDQNNNNQ